MTRLLTLLAVLCSFISSYANQYCYKDNCCDCASIGVEYLYLKPSVYDPYFIVPEAADDTPSGTRFGNLFPFHSGVRVKGSYNLPCSQLDLFGEGLYLSDREKKTVSFAPNDGLATKGFPNIDLTDLTEGTSDIHYRLWSLKGGFRYCLNMCYPLLASARIGIQYANIQFREKLDYVGEGAGDFSLVDYSTHGWGVGPEIGFDVGYLIFRCFSFVARGNYALLVGRIASSGSGIEIDASAVEDAVFMSNQKMSIVSPVSELKFGFNYALPFDCLCTNLEIGYDVIFYHNLISRIRGFGESTGVAGQEGNSFDHFSPFMVHGLYVSLSASF